MKTLYLVRHAKSDWANPMLTDFERPLNKRGKRDLPVMADRLAEREVMPDIIISSPAKRAKKTAKGLARYLGYAAEKIVFQDSIYEAGTPDLIEAIQQVPDAYHSLMLIGHNPGFTVLANLLSDARIQNVPTLGIVGISLPIDQWQKIGPGRGKLLFFEYPKNSTN